MTLTMNSRTAIAHEVCSPLLWVDSFTLDDDSKEDEDDEEEVEDFSLEVPAVCWPAEMTY